MPRRDPAPCPSFAELLERDTTTPAPASARACTDFLIKNHATFDDNRGQHASRLELACAILWVQAHRGDPDRALCGLSDAQRRSLLHGLDLDPDLLNNPSWPTRVARRAVAFMDPGSTPTKKVAAAAGPGPARGSGRRLSKAGPRRAEAASEGEQGEEDSPASPGPRRRARAAADSGSARVRGRGRPPAGAGARGARAAPADSEGEKDSDDSLVSPSPRRSPRHRRPGERRTSASRPVLVSDESASDRSGADSGTESDSGSSSSSGSSSLSSSDSGSRRRSSGRPRSRRSSHGPGEPRTAPSVDPQALELDSYARIHSLCRLPWIDGERLQRGLPSRWYQLLFCGHHWTAKQQREYDKTRRRESKRKHVRREDPTHPGWVHRLSFLYRGDNTLGTDAANLARLVQGESLSDFIRHGQTDHAAKSAYEDHLKEVRKRFQRITAALEQGHLPDEAEVGNACQAVLGTLSRRFAAMKRTMRGSGAAVTEVLANTARQYEEVREYLKRFRRDLTARTEGMADYQERFQYVGGRLEALLRPAAQQILAAESYDAGPVGPWAA